MVPGFQLRKSSSRRRRASPSWPSPTSPGNASDCRRARRGSCSANSSARRIRVSAPTSAAPRDLPGHLPLVSAARPADRHDGVDHPGSVAAEVGRPVRQLMARTFSPIPAPYRGPRLHPNDPYDPYVFRIDLALCGLGTAGSRSAPIMQGNDGVAPRRDSAVCKKEEQLGRTPSCKRPTRPARMGRSTMCGP